MNSTFCSKCQNWVLFCVDLLPPLFFFFKRANIFTDTSSQSNLFYLVCMCMCVGMWVSHMWRSEYNLEELNHLTPLGYLLPVCGLILELSICSHWPKEPAFVV